jgi:hypothetical protein
MVTAMAAAHKGELLSVIKEEAENQPSAANNKKEVPENNSASSSAKAANTPSSQAAFKARPMPNFKAIHNKTDVVKPHQKPLKGK